MKTIIRLFILNALIIGVGQLFFIQPVATYASPSAASFTYTRSPNVNFYDWNTVTDVISVDDMVGIDDIDLYLQVNHYAVGDLTVTLSHGDTTISIMDRPGYSGSGKGCIRNHVNATFDDDSSSPVETMCKTGTAISGSVHPEEDLSAFNGTLAQGSWTLTIRDNAGSDSGKFVRWDLLINGTLYTPDVSGGSVSSYGCASGALIVDFSVTTPPGTYRYIAGAWMLDNSSSGAQTGSHIMWREWTAVSAGGTTTASVPITETFDSSTLGLTYYPKSWAAAFGGNTISPNTHLRIFYQVWSEDFTVQYGSGVATIPNCSG